MLGLLIKGGGAGGMSLFSLPVLRPILFLQSALSNLCRAALGRIPSRKEDGYRVPIYIKLGESGNSGSHSFFAN